MPLGWWRARCVLASPMGWGECIGGPAGAAGPVGSRDLAWRGGMGLGGCGNLGWAACGLSRQEPRLIYSKNIARWQAGITLHYQPKRTATLGLARCF